MALSVVSVYISFAHMTGDLGTAPIALFFIGVLIKLGEIEKTNELEIEYD